MQQLLSKPNYPARKMTDPALSINPHTGSLLWVALGLAPPSPLWSVGGSYLTSPPLHLSLHFRE